MCISNSLRIIRVGAVAFTDSVCNDNSLYIFDIKKLNIIIN